MNEERVVALDPTSHGFGFVVLEGPTRLIDWGHAHARPCSAEKCLERVAELLSWYSPHVVITENCKTKGARRSPRVKKLLFHIRRFSEISGARVEEVSKARVQKVFSSGKPLKKHEIAQLIAAAFPELSLRLPPPRKIWMSEDERTSIFDAAALALTYFSLPEELETVEF